MSPSTIQVFYFFFVIFFYNLHSQLFNFYLFMKCIWEMWFLEWFFLHKKSKVRGLKQIALLKGFWKLFAK